MPFIAGHNDVGEFIARARGQAAQEEIVDDEQIGLDQTGAMLFAFAEFPGLKDFADEVVASR